MRLARWQEYESNEVELVKFVQSVILGPHKINGWDLKSKGGRSLEHIVIDLGVPPFEL
jgi:hypothetical protein